MLIQGQVVNAIPGARASGNPNAMQLALGELGVSEVLPRYAALAASGQLFTVACLAQATSLAGVALVGLQLWNRTSNKNLVLLKAAGAIVATSAANTSLSLAVGIGQVNAPTGQTAASFITNNLIGGAAPGALATAAGTFVNAPSVMHMLIHNTGAVATTGEDQGFFVDFEGSIIIPPNAYVAIVAGGAALAAAGSNLNLSWAELPI